MVSAKWACTQWKKREQAVHPLRAVTRHVVAYITRQGGRRPWNARECGCDEQLTGNEGRREGRSPLLPVWAGPRTASRVEEDGHRGRSHLLRLLQRCGERLTPRGAKAMRRLPACLLAVLPCVAAVAAAQPATG